MTIERICVFCGSREGARPEYRTSAAALGRALASRGLGLVYGGGAIGLMGVVADAALGAGGKVYGVIPKGLAAKEIAHHGLTELHVVKSMHERKATMEHLSQAFIALPGGFGTFEELLEIVTWIQLGLHRKPAGLLNVAGYYDPMLEQIRRAVDEGFISAALTQALLADTDPERLLTRLFDHQPPPPVVQWLRDDET